MFNNELAKQLKSAVESGKLKPKYFDGYQQWKQKFDYFFNKTNNVHETLNVMYGPGGGVGDYKGSIYHNSNIVVNKDVVKKKDLPKTKSHQHTSGSLKYLHFKKK
jgi:hypothetical protein